jgi:hypothetical protein
MGKYVHYQGLRFRTKEMVKAPRKRSGLPCYDKSICRVEHCSKYDTIVNEERITPFGDYKIECTIHRNPCDEDCKRRVNVDDVSVEVCIKAKCEFFKPQGCYCQKYVDECKKPHKTPAFNFPTGLRTPSGGGRGFYGHKRLDGKGFV